MCLLIYDSKSLPDKVNVVKSNDLFFNKNPVIPDTEECRNIIKIIDNAEYVSERSFRGRTNEMGNLDSKCLSTGSKTLINIISHTDVCFDVCECGDNVLNILVKLNEGIVYWQYPFVAYIGDPECDIYYDNKSFTNIFDFATYAVKKDS